MRTDFLLTSPHTFLSGNVIGEFRFRSLVQRVEKKYLPEQHVSNSNRQQQFTMMYPTKENVYSEQFVTN